MRTKTILIFCVLIQAISYGQASRYQPTFFNLMSVSGEFELNSFYQVEELNNFNYEKIEKTLFSGGGRINTKSYFWHPNFLVVDLDLGYNPSVDKLSFYASPERQFSTNSTDINFRTQWFRKHKFNWNTQVKYTKGIISRESLSNILSESISFGGGIKYNHKFAPLSISYDNTQSEQEELDTDRGYTNKRSVLSARTHKSFGKNDKTTLKFNNRTYSNHINNTSATNQTINEINVMNSQLFDKQKTSLNSRFLYSDQTGTNVKQKRLQLMESLDLHLLERLKLDANFSYIKLNQNFSSSDQTNYNVGLNHQLYLSLFSRINFQYNKNEHSAFTLKRSNYLGSLRYTKIIPWNGRLNMNYSYGITKKDNQTISISVPIFNEQYDLTDNSIVLLQNPLVDITTVVVKDITGAVTYQENLDYILIERDNFIEIQRIPAGLIANNQQVFIDYVIIQSNDYNYQGDMSNFYAGVTLFKSKLELYYKNRTQDYKSDDVFNLNLDNISQVAYGTRLDFGFLNAMVEYEDYKSRLIPSRSLKSNISIYGQIVKNISYSLQGNYVKYFMIFEEGQQQEYVNASANLNYKISAKTSLNILGSYRDQSSDSFNLNLFSSKLELKSRINSLYINAAIEVYKREQDEQQRNFASAKIRIIRKF